jgi:hypothetical protein
MKRPVFIFTIYLSALMSMAMALGPMTEDGDSVIITVAQAESGQRTGSDQV